MKKEKEIINNLVLNTEEELIDYKDYDILFLEVKYCKNLNKFVKIASSMLIDQIKLHIGYYRNYPGLMWFTHSGFESMSIKKLFKHKVKVLSKLHKGIRGLDLGIFPLVSKDLDFVKPLVNLRKLSLAVYSGDKNSHPLDLSILGDIKGMTSIGLWFLDLYLRKYPEGEPISLETLKTTKHLQKLSIISDARSNLTDLDVLADMQKLEEIRFERIKNIDKFSILLKSDSLKKIYVDKFLFKKIDNKLQQEFKEKQVLIESSN